MILIVEHFLDGCFFLIGAHKGIEDNLIFICTALGGRSGKFPDCIQQVLPWTVIVPGQHGDEEDASRQAEEQADQEGLPHVNQIRRGH